MPQLVMMEGPPGAGKSTLADDLVFDWNAVGMIEDLPCANPKAVAPTGDDPAAFPDGAILAEHADAVRRLWPGTSTLLVLDVPVETAIARATSERGESWTERETARLAAGVSIVEFQRSLDARRRGIVDAYEAAGWVVVRLDASSDPNALSASALAAVMPNDL